MNAQMPLPGEVFQSRYRMERLLGSGGFAQVFVATDVELRREVAIKVLRPQGDGYDDRNAARFMREAKVVASLNHPHIVTMFDYGSTADGLLFAVFEHVGGTDLSRLMTGPLPEDVTVHILAQLLEALDAAHQQGLLHRDVKPDNVRVFRYMDDPHRVKLLDFGIARPTKDDAGLTASGMVVGTPRFMAPEVLYEEPLGPHSDIYSLGLVAFEMLTGRRSDHLQRLIHQQPVELPDDARVNATLRQVINRMLERHVPPRYATAAAVRADLLAAVRGPASSHEPPLIDVSMEAIEVVAEPRARPVTQTALFAAAGVSLMLTLLAVAMLVGLSTDSRTADATKPMTTTGESEDRIRIEPLPSRAVTVTATTSIVETDAGRAAAGCGSAPGFAGTRTLTQPVGLDAVEWVVHVPEGYRPAEPHALVVMLHDDSGTSARQMVETTRFAATADEHGFLIAAPNDDDIAYPWTEPEDLEHVEHVVDLMRDSFCVDENRIFLVGHGGGGWGVDALSCRPWVAGVAFSAFLLEDREFTCEPERPVPALTILPLNSGFLPAEGGPDCLNNSKLGFDEFESMWGDRNTCGSRRRPFGRAPGGKCVDFGCETPFVACRVDGGRRWPGAPERAVDLFQCDGPGNTFPYNETIWRFFDGLETRGG